MFHGLRKCLSSVFYRFELYYWILCNILWFFFLEWKQIRITASYSYDYYYNPLAVPIDYLPFTMIMVPLGYIIGLLQIKSQDHCSKIKEKLLTMVTELELLIPRLSGYNNVAIKLTTFPDEFRKALSAKPDHNTTEIILKNLKDLLGRYTLPSEISNHFDQVYRLANEVDNVEVDHIYTPLYDILAFGLIVIVTGITVLFWSRLGYVFGTFAAFAIVVVFVGLVDIAKSRNGFHEILAENEGGYCQDSDWLSRWREKVQNLK